MLEVAVVFCLCCERATASQGLGKAQGRDSHGMRAWSSQERMCRTNRQRKNFLMSQGGQGLADGVDVGRDRHDAKYFVTQ